MDLESVTFRATPKTERGERRVSLILDATEEVLSEVGYEAATTNAIAQRAGTSIGSLYQFFANKEVLVQALAERYREELKALFDTAVSREEDARFPGALNLLADELVSFSARKSAFEVLFCNAGGPLQQLVPSAILAEEMDERVDRVFMGWAPQLSVQQRRLHARVCVLVAQSLLPHTHVGPTIVPAMVTELKQVLYRYLAPIFA